MTCHPGAEGDRVQLSLPVAFHRFHVQALHEVVVLGDVAEHELAHHAVGGLMRPFGSYAEIS